MNALFHIAEEGPYQFLSSSYALIIICDGPESEDGLVTGHRGPRGEPRVGGGLAGREREMGGEASHSHGLGPAITASIIPQQ